jgi:hypothetical protein
MTRDDRLHDDGRINQDEQKREEEARGAKTPELRRRGPRSGAGSDTPSGPSTSRTPRRAKRQVKDRNARGTTDRTEAEKAAQKQD